MNTKKENEIGLKLDEFRKEMEEYQKNMTIFTKIYYWCYRNLNVVDWYRECKWFLQRVFRGYSDRDLWNIGNHLGQTILKCLKAFKKMNKCGYPAFLTEEGIEQEDGEKKWDNMVDEMIEGFEYLTTDRFDTEEWQQFMNNEISFEKCSKITEKKYRDAEKKAMLFVKHINSLWD